MAAYTPTQIEFLGDAVQHLRELAREGYAPRSAMRPPPAGMNFDAAVRWVEQSFIELVYTKALGMVGPDWGDLLEETCQGQPGVNQWQRAYCEYWGTVITLAEQLVPENEAEIRRQLEPANRKI